MSKLSIIVLILVAVAAIFYLSASYTNVALGPVASIVPELCCPTPKPPPPQCTCYFSSDCQSGQFCDWGAGCQEVPKENGTPKLDGMCKARNSKASWREVDATKVTAAIAAWFQAYANAGDLGGIPNVADIKAISLPVVWHVETASAVFNVMDRLLGFDFSKPAPCGAFDTAVFDCPPAIPQLDAAGKSLVASVGIAFAEAVRTANPKLVEEPLNAFWKKYPTYKPMHAGRCYPHGHAEVTKGGERKCQINELEQILSAFLVGRE